MVSHLDPDRLVLLALGDLEADELETSHLRRCPDCAAEWTALRAVTDLGREASMDEGLQPVSEQVWARIVEETGQATATVAAPSSIPQRPSRSRRRLRLAGVAVAAATIGVLGTIAVTEFSATEVPADRVVAQAELTPQGAAPPAARGRAQIVDTPTGKRLRLTMDGMPAPDGLYEIWLFDGDASMIALGVVAEANQVEVPVPASITVTAYPVVDVSEQRIGQQEHGISVLQGKLIG